MPQSPGPMPIPTTGARDAAKPRCRRRRSDPRSGQPAYQIAAVPRFLYAARNHDANTTRNLAFPALRFWVQRLATVIRLVRRRQIFFHRKKPYRLWKLMPRGLWSALSARPSRALRLPVTWMRDSVFHRRPSSLPKRRFRLHRRPRRDRSRFRLAPRARIHPVDRSGLA